MPMDTSSTVTVRMDTSHMETVRMDTSTTDTVRMDTSAMTTFAIPCIDEVPLGLGVGQSHSAAVTACASANTGGARLTSTRGGRRPDGAFDETGVVRDPSQPAQPLLRPAARARAPRRRETTHKITRPGRKPTKQGTEPFKSLDQGDNPPNREQNPLNR